MNYSLLTLEILVSLLGIGVLLADLWIPASARKLVGYGAATFVGILLTYAIGGAAPADGTAFGGMFIVDAMSNFFKGFFLLAALVVLLLSLEYADKLVGYAEYCALTIFALAGMLFAASANDFILMFVALELITITFYILVSFQRGKVASIEAGVKYLIMGAVASGFMVFGTALIFGSANTTNFFQIATQQAELAKSPLFVTGLLLVVVGLGFKIAAFPFQMWAPDVYQGAPAPTVAFLATGSKAAGFALLLRIAFGVVPDLTAQWSKLFLGFGIVTILYGSLCAIPQRSVKRLMGYSSIANAGFLLLGIAAASLNGSAAVMTYLGGYIFTVLAAFAAISVVVARTDSDDFTAFAGLGQRSPWLAAALTVGMVSLAGIPPLAGFFAKFYLLRAVAEHVATDKAFLVALLVACVGVVISLYYYFGVLRAAFFPKTTPTDLSALPIGGATKLAIILAIAGTLYLGVEPESLVKGAKQAAAGLEILPAADEVHTAAK
jgi:NADH-quinone oxidoreductase subunit N